MFCTYYINKNNKFKTYKGPSIKDVHKIWLFFDPPPPCVRIFWPFTVNSSVRIWQTPPSPLDANVLYGWPLSLVAPVSLVAPASLLAHLSLRLKWALGLGFGTFKNSLTPWWRHSTLFKWETYPKKCVFVPVDDIQKVNKILGHFYAHFGNKNCLNYDI